MLPARKKNDDGDDPSTVTTVATTAQRGADGRDDKSINNSKRSNSGTDEDLSNISSAMNRSQSPGLSHWPYVLEKLYHVNLKGDNQSLEDEELVGRSLVFYAIGENVDMMAKRAKKKDDPVQMESKSETI